MESREREDWMMLFSAMRRWAFCVVIEHCMWIIALKLWCHIYFFCMTLLRLLEKRKRKKMAPRNCHFYETAHAILIVPPFTSIVWPPLHLSRRLPLESVESKSLALFISRIISRRLFYPFVDPFGHTVMRRAHRLEVRLLVVLVYLFFFSFFFFLFRLGLLWPQTTPFITRSLEWLISL